MAKLSQRSRRACSSSTERPATNDTYPGTSGSTHGDRNETTPASSAVTRPMLAISSMTGGRGSVGAHAHGFGRLRSAALDRLAKELEHLGRRPVGHAQAATDFPALAVDQQRRRDAVDAERGERLPARLLDVEREVPHADVLVELAYRARPLVVHRQRHDLEVRAAELRLQRVEGRHFLATRRAPRGPEVQHHHAPAEILEAARVPVA